MVTGQMPKHYGVVQAASETITLIPGIILIKLLESIDKAFPPIQ